MARDGEHQHRRPATLIPGKQEQDTGRIEPTPERVGAK